MPSNLTADMTAFQEQGYLVIPEVLGPAEVAAAQQEIERLHELAAGEGTPPAEATFQFEPHTDVRSEHGRPVLRKIERTDLVSDLFAGMARNPRMVAVVSEILGPELLLFRSTLMLKPARHGSQHGLHQDVAYWPLEPPDLVTLSIAISASDAENGCIHVIPGSHRWPVGEWGNISRRDGAAQTDREDVDLSQLRDVPLEAGSAVLFHSNIVHGSGPNHSDRPRHTALYAFFPPTARYMPTKRDSPSKTYPVVAGLNGLASVTLGVGESALSVT
ncbi:MAG: phytanoyl-CoA dioxygenase family protein [Spirochaetaceae bacterium]|nr:phytanoyl-CoA dioxygenase family protein [Spirochaetaceae bacterium]